jgi:Domain of unknown function (DUF4326)
MSADRRSIFRQGAVSRRRSSSTSATASRSTSAAPCHRASIFPNPFRIPQHGNREQVIAAYRKHLQAHPELVEQAKALRGKRLGCWGKPESCHGDLLAAIADGRDW